MNQLSGKVALVTGAARGIGAAILAAFAEEGAQVVGMDLAEAPGLVRGDVGRPEDCEAAVAEVVRRHGRLHVLVNNAATGTVHGTVEDVPLDAWQRILTVNLTGAMLMSRFAIPVIAAAGGGSIVHIASQLGRVATPRNAAYCAAKGALIQLAKAMAIDHAAQNIRCNTLSPGVVGTDRIWAMHATKAEAEAARGPKHVLGRIGRPDEIAAAAVFLASDASSFMTGTDLLVDGGYTAW